MPAPNLADLALDGLALTDNARQWLVVKPITVVVIVVVAILARLLIHRFVDRLTKPRNGGRMPAILRPVRDRAPDRVRSATSPLLHERRQQRAETMGSVLKSVTSILVLALAVIYALGVLGLNVAPLIASAGIVGVALGFGAQNLVRDFISGIFMILEDQYGVGDVVDLGAASGVVENVGLRVTSIRDVNGTLWYCRNGEVQRVGNKSQGFAVAVLDLPLAHTTDVDVASAIASRVATEAVSEPPLVDDVIAAPEVLGVDKVTADTVTLRLTVKVRPGRQWAVQRALNQRILDAFDQNGVRPPYPQGRPLGTMTAPDGTST
ncbi:MAG: mechanosensitive ion channel family protein [Mycobacteriaceae bacterium]